MTLSSHRCCYQHVVDTFHPEQTQQQSLTLQTLEVNRQAQCYCPPQMQRQLTLHAEYPDLSRDCTTRLSGGLIAVSLPPNRIHSEC